MVGWGGRGCGLWGILVGVGCGVVGDCGGYGLWGSGLGVGVGTLEWGWTVGVGVVVWLTGSVGSLVGLGLVVGGLRWFVLAE